MKKRTTLLALATLLSAGFMLQAQKLTRPLLSPSPIVPQHIAPIPLATSDATDKTHWQWGKSVHKLYQDGQWVISNEGHRTFDENDRIATSTYLYYNNGEINQAIRDTYQYDGNGFCNYNESFTSKDGVNFIPVMKGRSEADPVFTQTTITQDVQRWNTETNQWEIVEAMTFWKEVKRDNEGRITEVIQHLGPKPVSNSNLVLYRCFYKDGERAPYQIDIWPDEFNYIAVKNIKWHETDENFIWLGSYLDGLFFDNPDLNQNISKNNKPTTYEVYNAEGKLEGTNTYTYQADGSYERIHEGRNYKGQFLHQVLDEYGSYEEFTAGVSAEGYSWKYVRHVHNEQGNIMKLSKLIAVC